MKETVLKLIIFHSLKVSISDFLYYTSSQDSIIDYFELGNFIFVVEFKLVHNVKHYCFSRFKGPGIFEIRCNISRSRILKNLF